jgi:hypothetical protein
LMGLIGLLSLVKKPFHIVATAVFVAALINASVIYAQYILDFLHMDSSWLVAPSFNKEILVAYRKPGLMSGYPAAGMLSLYGVLFGVWMICRKFSLSLFLPIIVLTAALFLTSRTALYLGMVVIFLFFVTFSLRRSAIKMLLVVVLLIPLFIYFLIKSDIVHTDTIKVMFEVFIRFSETGQIFTHSSDATLNSLMYYPEVKTFLIGNGLLNLTDQLTTIDSGYQKMLFGGGIFYLVTIVFLFFGYWYLASRFLKDRYLMFVTHSIYIVVFLANLKGGTIFAQVIGDVPVMLSTCGLIHILRKETKVFLVPQYSV